MSAPLVVNTADGTAWVLHTVTRSGLALYAVAGACKCPSYLLATLAELAEHGIAGEADALPVPVGPQMPDFPPPPRTELEKLHAERARLQGLLAEAVADAHRARRERDLMRERVSEPYGCKHCGEAKRSHGRRWITGAGVHAWEAPADEQVKTRMLARRVARMPLPADPEVERLLDELAGVNLSLWEEERAYERLRVALESARRGRRESRARVAELEAQRERRRVRLVALQNDALSMRGSLSPAGEGRKVPFPLGETLTPAVDWLIARVAELEAERHSTNESLSNAAEALRADRDRIAELDARLQAVAEYATSRVTGTGADNEASASWVLHLLGVEPDEAPADGIARLNVPLQALRGDEDVSPQVEKLRALLAGQRAVLEDPHDGPLHHDYRVGRDLPPVGGAG